MRDINQEVILSVPDLLSKLVEQASRVPYNPRYASTPAEIGTGLAVGGQAQEEGAEGTSGPLAYS